MARPTAKVPRRETVASLASGSFEAGLAGVLGAGGGFAEGVAGGLTRGPLVTELATEEAPPAGVVAGGSFDAGPTRVVALLPKPAYPSRRVTRTAARAESRDVIVALSSGGMDYGPQAVVDPWGRAGGFEAGLTGAIAARRESVQLAGGPSAEVADGSLEAGLARVILRPVRRGGNPVVVSKPIPLPGVPLWGYALARGERVHVTRPRLSRCQRRQRSSTDLSGLLWQVRPSCASCLSTPREVRVLYCREASWQQHGSLRA